MNHGTLKGRITRWRNKATMVEKLADKARGSFTQTELAEARGYAAALRECADQMETSFVRSTQNSARPDPGH